MSSSLSSFLAIALPALSTGVSVSLYADYMRGSSFSQDFAPILMIAVAYAVVTYAVDMALGDSKSVGGKLALAQIVAFGFAPAAAYYFFGITGVIPLAGAFLVNAIVQPIVMKVAGAILAVLYIDSTQI